MQNDIIKNAPTSEFTGVFNFTNASDEDFKVSWNNIEYTFKAQSTSPMIISGESLENIQNIRKLFARKLAERQFFKSDKYFQLNSMGQGIPPLYDEKVLEPYIQMCLEPLPITRAETRELPRQSSEDIEDKIEVLDETESLVSRAKEGKGKKTVNV